MDKSSEIAKINDRLRRAMPLGQVDIELSPLVSSSAVRADIIKAVRSFKDFDPEIDLTNDHSVGVVVVAGDVYVFRFTYGDERYDYSKEVGKRSLRIEHSSEFRSLKLGRRVLDTASRLLDQEIG